MRLGRRRTSKPTEAALLVGGGGLGVLLGFFLDPSLGRRRRAYVRDRSAGIVRRNFRRVVRRGRGARAHGYGYVARIRHTRTPQRTQLDDATLTSKIETELFRPVDVPKGQINVNVQDGVVQLRGEVPGPDMMRELVEKARKIGGVREVENLLHLPNMPAPMHR